MKVASVILTGLVIGAAYKIGVMVGEIKMDCALLEDMRNYEPKVRERVNYASGSIPSRDISYGSRYHNGKYAYGRYPWRNHIDYKELALQTKGEAIDLLDSLNDIIENYGMVSVAELYELNGMDSDYTDNNIGWKDLKDAEIVPRKGFGIVYLKLPEAIKFEFEQEEKENKDEK